MDDIKLFAKNEKELEILCEDTGCCSEDLPRAMNDWEEWRERVRDIRATSAIWWWWWWWYWDRMWHRKIHHVSNEKRKTTYDRKNRNTKSKKKKKMKTLEEKETYKYLGILEADILEQMEMKVKIKKEHLRRKRNLLKTKLYSRNLIKAINT